MELTFGLPGAIPVWIQWKGRLSASGLRGHPYSSTFKEETGNPSGNYSWNKGACHRHSGSQNVFRRGGGSFQNDTDNGKVTSVSNSAFNHATRKEKNTRPNLPCSRIIFLIAIAGLSWVRLRYSLSGVFAILMQSRLLQSSLRECQRQILQFWCVPDFGSPVPERPRDRQKWG